MHCTGKWVQEERYTASTKHRTSKTRQTTQTSRKFKNLTREQRDLPVLCMGMENLCFDMDRNSDKQVKPIVNHLSC